MLAGCTLRSTCKATSTPLIMQFLTTLLGILALFSTTVAESPFSNVHHSDPDSSCVTLVLNNNDSKFPNKQDVPLRKAWQAFLCQRSW